ncbi:MAG: hypothetical protein H7318_17585 [Oligoflexus sp.]|nr:hypothetical protein [Oligoflexus sp.]
MLRVNDLAGGIRAPGGKPAVAFCFMLKDGKIFNIDIVMDAKSLKTMDFKFIDPKNDENS